MVYVTVKENGPLTHDSFEKLSFLLTELTITDFFVFFGSCLGFFYVLVLHYGWQYDHPFFLSVFQQYLQVPATGHSTKGHVFDWETELDSAPSKYGKCLWPTYREQRASARTHLSK